MDLQRDIAEMLAIVSEGRERYGQAAAAQCRVFHGEAVSRQPLLLQARDETILARYREMDYEEIHADPQKMLYAGLKSALQSTWGGREAVPSLRANMGCGIVPALFGLKQELFPDKMPWLQKRLCKGRIREMGEGDLSLTPEFRLALTQMEYLAEALRDSGARVYPLDIQGAFDTAHLVYGDDIFYDLYDDPDFVHHLLDLSCAAIEIAFRECLKRMPGADAFVPHYNALAMPRDMGGLKVSEDTSTLLNAACVREFVAPYLHRTLQMAGGGYVHYCGKNPHLYQTVLAEPLAHGLNFGNPEMQDMEAALGDLAVRGKVYYGQIPRAAGEPLGRTFSRLRRAATADGRTWLLLNCACARAEAAEISDLWDQYDKEDG